MLNFCDDFQLAAKRAAAPSGTGEARTALDRLFRKD